MEVPLETARQGGHLLAEVLLPRLQIAAGGYLDAYRKLPPTEQAVLQVSAVATATLLQHGRGQGS